MNRKMSYAIICCIMTLVIVLCVCWYNYATTDIEKTEVNHEAIFTKEDYPKIDASLAIHPLADEIASNFLNIPIEEINYKYTNTRTSEVYHNLIDGNVDVIIASEISEEDKKYAQEKGIELEIVPTTSSAFVFIVNTDNIVDNLSLEQVQKIYSGEITNWKEVGGIDAEIIAYQRPEGSGSQTALKALVMKGKELKQAPTREMIIGMGGLIDAVAEYDNSINSIGYSYFYYVNTMYKRDTIKMLSIDGVEPKIENIKNGKYPLYTNGFIVYRKIDSDNENIQKWIKTVLSKRGSKIIEETGYVPVN